MLLQQLVGQIFAEVLVSPSRCPMVKFVLRYLNNAGYCRSVEFNNIGQKLLKCVSTRIEVKEYRRVLV